MPLYVLVAAVAVNLSIPILWFSLATDKAPGQLVSDNLTAGVAKEGLRGLVLSQSPLERILQPAFRGLARWSRRLSPAGLVPALERRLELAGVKWPVERVLILKLMLGGGLLVSGLIRALTMGSQGAFFTAVAAGAVGYLGPDTVLSRKATARQLTISNQLPDTLDQLTICVEAGLSFDAAMARTSKAGDGPLDGEITRLLQELRFGLPRREALDNLLARTDVPELRQFVHDVIQAESYGLPISRVLRTQAIEQREKRRFRAEEQAMKLPVKVIFPMIFCILPALFIVILAPAYLHISAGL